MARTNYSYAMTRRLLFLGLMLFIGVFFGTTGCQIIDGGSRVDDGYGDLIWVAQEFTGGQQCNPHVSFDPPDTEQQLEDAGVGVFETVVEMHAVCEACFCPSYSATHYAQIRTSNLEGAQDLGYEESDGPTTG